MINEELQKLKFPLGEFVKPSRINISDRNAWIKTISEFPDALLNRISAISKEQKKSKYRLGGWSVSQVVHHCADSHMNAFIRFKLALTEDEPTVRPYLEDKWGELHDSTDRDLMPSINLLIGLHARWTVLLESMTEDEFKRTYFHPESKQVFLLHEVLSNYAWHCDHHLEHVKIALDANGKYN